jgi:hypothetical protein
VVARRDHDRDGKDGTCAYKSSCCMHHAFEHCNVMLKVTALHANRLCIHATVASALDEYLHDTSHIPRFCSAGDRPWPAQWQRAALHILMQRVLHPQCGSRAGHATHMSSAMLCASSERPVKLRGFKIWQPL